MSERSQSRSEETVTAEEYVLGVDDRELARLGFQHRVWAKEAHELWRTARVGPDQRVLDLGAGPGFASVDLAHLVGPGGEVIALDEAQRFLDHIESLKRSGACPAHVRTMRAKAEAFECAPGSVDVVFARWLLCFSPHPAAAIGCAARALAPGGRMAIQDYTHYQLHGFNVDSEVFARTIAAAAQSFALHGGDANIGWRLPALLDAAGLRVVSLRSIVRLARPGEALWEWPRSFWRSYAPKLVAMGLLDEADCQAFLDLWEERSRNPQALFMTPPMLAIVAEKPA